MRRLLQLASVVLGLLIGLEVLCRVERDGLGAVAHRVRFKLALLRNKGPVDFVVLGSSRSNDGLEPSLLNHGAGFLAATPSSSLATLQYFAENIGPQKLVLVELSSPQWDPAPLEFDAPPPTDFAGDPLGKWLHHHSELLKVRRAFALENLPRVGGLLVASRLDGSEWFRARFVSEGLLPAHPPENLTDQSAWTSIAPTGDPSLLDADARRIIDGYVKIIEVIRRGGARVVLVSPPLAKLWRVDDCVPVKNAIRAAVKERVNAPLLDFTCADVDDRWFVDGQHLSAAGRAQFSKVLAEALNGLP